MSDTNSSPKAKKTPTPRVVAASEAELRTHAQPEGRKAYCVRNGDKVCYTYASNPGSAAVNCYKQLGVTATRLGTGPKTAETMYSEMMNMAPTELQALIARMNQGGQVGPVSADGAKQTPPPAEQKQQKSRK
jgi:hypothetical protein